MVNAHTQTSVTAARTPIRKVVFASLIGTAIEWYDFFLYGSAAALVFGAVFFPSQDPATGALLAFGTYAVGFVARPLGGIIFGHFGDRVGRKKMLVVSLVLMGAATFAIGLLPTYATIGVAAPMLLVFCRLLQGFAVGGEWGGAVLMAAEHGDDRHRGFWSSWPQAGVPLGNLIAAVVLWVLAAVQSDSDFLAWGWRIPFLLSAVLVLVGLWVRLSIEESPVFAEAKKAASMREKAKAPIFEVLRKYPREVAIAMGMRMAENIAYYIFSIVVITYMRHLSGNAQGRRYRRRADRLRGPVRAHSDHRILLRPRGPPAPLPGRSGRHGVFGVSSFSRSSTPVMTDLSSLPSSSASSAPRSCTLPRQRSSLNCSAPGSATAAPPSATSSHRFSPAG